MALQSTSPEKTDASACHRRPQRRAAGWLGENRQTRTMFTLAATVVLVVGESLPGQILIEGVTDKEVYTDRASFRVPSEPGYDYTVELNGDSVPTDVANQVDQAEYYELLVRRTQDGTGDEESRLVRFIVRASERKNSEWGLPPWVPYPVIPSAAAEFAGAELKIVTPADFPQGLEIPVIARVEDGDGARVPEKRARPEARRTRCRAHEIPGRTGSG